METYSNQHTTIEGLLGDIRNNNIAIPEIQRPFVWLPKQVRDLIDSLYKGFPTGYIILWQNPDIKLKDGTISGGKKVLIDGQQRITALMTAIAGKEIITKDYKTDRYRIAFNPYAALSNETDAEIFAVRTPAHEKSSNWIPDISIMFDSNFSSRKFINAYCEKNPSMDPDELEKIIDKLRAINQRQIGYILLSSEIDIDVVTEIFIRINSKGTALSQGDFVMSKIAADEDHGGNTLRKAIDYFSHLAIEPSYYDYIKFHDNGFNDSEYMPKLAWLRDDTETVYDPNCDDVIRVAFMHQFSRAKLADLVKLLSGRDFETKDYKAEIIDETYAKLKQGVLNFINQEYFSQFLIAIKSAGFINDKMVNSNMAIDFAYTIFLMLVKSKEIATQEIKSYVQRWYVLTVLLGRYSSSPETAFAKDLRRISEIGVAATLKEIEDARLSDNFWNVEVVQNLSYSSTNNPTYLVYLAAQIYFNDISMLSHNIPVKELIALGGDVHHIFPKNYLSKNKYEKNMYNQEANYVFLDRQVHSAISDRAPYLYFASAKKQCETGTSEIGSIYDWKQLQANLEANCIPLDVFEMNAERYPEFLAKRRAMMAQKIRKFYESL